MGCTSASSGGDAHGPPAWLPRDKGHAGGGTAERRGHGQQARAQAAAKTPSLAWYKGERPIPSTQGGGTHARVQRLQGLCKAPPSSPPPECFPREKGCRLTRWPDLPQKKKKKKDFFFFFNFFF